MKKIFLMFTICLCISGISGQVFAVESYLEHKRHMEENNNGGVSTTVGPYRAHPGDPAEERNHYHGNAVFRPGAAMLETNKHVFAFIPKDIT